MIKVSKEQLVDICHQLTDRVKDCPKCGKQRVVVAVFQDNEHDEVIGWRIICQCDDPKDYGKIPILTIEQLFEEMND